MLWLVLYEQTTLYQLHSVRHVQASIGPAMNSFPPLVSSSNGSYIYIYVSYVYTLFLLRYDAAVSKLYMR